MTPHLSMLGLIVSLNLCFFTRRVSVPKQSKHTIAILAKVFHLINHVMCFFILFLYSFPISQWPSKSWLHGENVSHPPHQFFACPPHRHGAKSQHGAPNEAKEFQKDLKAWGMWHPSWLEDHARPLKRHLTRFGSSCFVQNLLVRYLLWLLFGCVCTCDVFHVWNVFSYVVRDMLFFPVLWWYVSILCSGVGSLVTFICFYSWKINTGYQVFYMFNYAFSCSVFTEFRCIQSNRPNGLSSLFFS